MKYLFLFFAFSMCVQTYAQPAILKDDIVASYNWLAKAPENPTCDQSKNKDFINLEETDIKTCAFIDQFKMYPNPTDQTLTLTFKSAKSKVEMRISKISGESVYEKTLALLSNQYESNFSTESFDPGIYILQLIYQGESFNRKLIVE